jgi:hypothetical protein
VPAEMRVGNARSVAHQAAGFGSLTPKIDRRHPLVRRQRDELYATVVEERAGTDQERINWLLRKARKDRIDVATGAGVEDFDLLPNSRSRSPDV